MAKDTTGGKNVKYRGDGSGDALGPNSEIGKKLKQYYDELLTDEVPDRFTQLLSQLEQTGSDGRKD